ncbi:MAG: cobyrinate a,c-diamide synthase [Acidimicrobiia bacterium]
MILGPRLVIAGTHSGAGKTTIATGLMAAFGRRGVKVASAKVGPDFIDPSYHALATGRPGRNLDPWMCGPDAMGSLAGRAASDAELLVIEGVMGLFDGAQDAAPSSTADVAALLDAPVVLVVDAAGLSQSIAAVVHGYNTSDPRVGVAGVICNRVGSARHLDILRSALEQVQVPLLGALGRDDVFSWRDRHLGLVPVVERPGAVRTALDHLADAIERDCDLDAISRVATTAREMPVGEPELPEPVTRVRVAVASGRAFSFMYTDNLEALASAGAELVSFDPCEDRRLPPDCKALVVGGGFPEVYVGALADNTELLTDVRRRVDDGLVVWAECGGLLWLADDLDGRSMAGVIPTSARMTDRLTLGYRRATTMAPSPLGRSGLGLRGHEFHYSTVVAEGDGLELTAPTGTTRGGWARPGLLASYLHLHLGAAPELATAFARAAAGSPEEDRSR